ncbi:MAG: hypothetical protein K8J31_29530 [Anaerolineae bacterium]|nr:hypothetical protein [Anaerolineae bacterium]
MRFIMYSENSIAQAMRAINERLHAPGTKSRPQIDGWVEKNGNFAMTVTTTVYGPFRRRTTLRGRAERDGGNTVIRGSVPGGLSRNKQLTILGIMIVLGLLALSQGNAILMVVSILAGAALSIPMQGDFNNSELLLTELQRTLKARFTQPK